MRLTIARPWHLLSQKSVDGTRNALIDMLRFGPDATSLERRGGFLTIGRMLDVLLTGCRSVSWTQQAGHRCPACGTTVPRDAAPGRLTAAVAPFDADEARLWQELARQRFQGDPSARTTSPPCPECANVQMAPINLRWSLRKI